MGTIRVKALIALLLAVATAGSARATIVIDFPMTYQTDNIVGTVEGRAGDNPGDDASVFAQKLLNVEGQGQLWTDTTDGNRLYHTGAVDYSGTIIGLGIKTDTSNPGESVYIPGGYTFAIGKYDGKNAGWVLFYLGGDDAYVPGLSHSFWGDLGSEDYKLSNFTVFNPAPEPSPPVPEPSTVIAGALLLLPFGVSALRILRRKA